MSVWKLEKSREYDSGVDVINEMIWRYVAEMEWGKKTERVKKEVLSGVWYDDTRYCVEADDFVRRASMGYYFHFAYRYSEYGPAEERRMMLIKTDMKQMRRTVEMWDNVMGERRSFTVWVIEGYD